MKRLWNKAKDVFFKTREILKAIVVAVGIATVGLPSPVLAGGDYLSPINNLKTVLLAVIKVAGAIVCVFGIIRVAMAFPRHDQNAEYAGIYTIVAGALMVGAGLVLTALGV